MTDTHIDQKLQDLNQRTSALEAMITAQIDINKSLMRTLIDLDLVSDADIVAYLRSLAEKAGQDGAPKFIPQMYNLMADSFAPGSQSPKPELTIVPRHEAPPPGTEPGR
ncbi:hypothetical protein PVW47_01495 [Marinovum sp. SP66]|uniref:hypothetical protein n=1 Tax=Marinovum TaxID=367771 RepID=UPI00237BA3A7|nr:hypothetical protein [Marinovum sp. SP66]MDD9738447.1 hypothetical protein [Marinovum sp. SP66]